MQSGHGDTALADFLSKTAKMRLKLKKVAYRVLKDAESNKNLHPSPPRDLSSSSSSESHLLPLVKRPARHSPLRTELKRTSASPFSDQFSRTATNRPLFHILESTSSKLHLQALRKSLANSKVYKSTTPPPLLRRLQKGKVALGKVSPGRSSTRSISPYPSARNPYSPVPGLGQSRK